MIDSFFGTDRDVGRNTPDCRGYWGYDDVVEDGNRCVPTHDKYRSLFPIWRFHQPNFTLRYQDSASVSAIALAIAQASSESVCGFKRYASAIV